MDPSNETGLGAVADGVDISSLNASSNATAAVSSAWSLKTFADMEFFLLEARLVFSALAIIYAGAHGALRRPPSAAPAKKKSKGDKKEEPFTEGLMPSDAILFPLLAGAVLVGLYYLIKWLQDPAILNRILRAYMSTVAVVSMTKLLADGLDVMTNFVFPKYWRSRAGAVLRIDPNHRAQFDNAHTPAGQNGNAAAAEERAPLSKTPFPGPVAYLNLSDKTNRAAWQIRHLLSEKWTVRLHIHGIASERFGIKFNDLVAALLALSIAVTYYVTEHTGLSNLLGYGYCYGTFMILSPTSFTTGTLVLFGLFVYDIVMVFYTPYMITVATKLDVPIKLVFGGPSRSSLLGLGDIVLPGIFMCLALRFDLWRHYRKYTKYVPKELETETVGENSETSLTTKELKHVAVKKTFVSPQGQWGDRFWMARWFNVFSRAEQGEELAATRFPKTYFYASMIGYTVGMLITLAMLITFRHGQPALLYLVPGVVGSVWLTGLWRGELKELHMYTEDGSLDTEDVVVELDGNGNVIREFHEENPSEQKEEDKAAQPEGADKDQQVQPDKVSESNARSQKEGTGSTDSGHKQGHNVFLLSITAPASPGIPDEDPEEE